MNDEHPVRPRRTAFGELVQLDASPHDWLSLGSLDESNYRLDRKIALHLAIDDATSQLLGGYFCQEETLVGYYQVVYQLLTKYGIPSTFYTDRRTIFEYRAKLRVEDENIQFKRACNELGVGIISTSVAQAKGRVERSFRTHQDRLINELKYAGITTIEDANKFLGGYMAKHNKKYALDIPLDNTGRILSAFRPLNDLGSQIDIRKILSIIEKRKVLNGGLISFGNRQYYLTDDDGIRLFLPADTSVEVVKTFNEQLLVKYGNKYYHTEHFADGRLTAHAPPPTHPWRRTYHH